MLNLKLLFLTLILSSCVTPVQSKDWYFCEAICMHYGGLKEACKERPGKVGCHCEDDVIFWKYENPNNQFDVTQPYE